MIHVGYWVGECVVYYSETSEQWTLWDKYKFEACPLYRGFQSHYIDGGGGIKFGDLVLSIRGRYLIQCPFSGGSGPLGAVPLYNN